MIPRARVLVDPNLPTEATFWTPLPEDISEEGFGFFHDTWPITEVTLEEARGVLEEEKRIIAFVDNIAPSADAFEQLLQAVEAGDLTELPASLISVEHRSKLEDLFVGEDSPIGQLDLGVVGSVYSLSAAGCFPAASCRGHGGDYSWSPNPVVYTAADRLHAEAIRPLVLESGCGFAWDEIRPDLLVVQASSISEMLALSDLLMKQIEQGLLPLSPHSTQLDRRAADQPDRIHRPSPECEGQLSLFGDDNPS